MSTTKEVPQSDREKSVEIFRILLNALDLGVNYQTTELLIKSKQAIDKRGGKMNLQHALELKTEWGEKWAKYFKELEKSKKS